MKNSDALYSVAEIRAIEHAALARLPAGTLMQRAGRAAANAAIELLVDSAPDAKILILAGPGNNGGDALEAAAQLAGSGLNVSILLFADPSKQGPDALQALQRAKADSIYFIDPSDPSVVGTTDWSLVIDGLFGIGLTRTIQGELYAVIERVNALRCPILALDVPSGLDADTGNIVGTRGIALRATHTVTFIGDKTGLHTGSGRDYVGRIEVVDLGIDDALFPAALSQLNAVRLFASALRPRAHDSHKGSYGDVAVIGGTHGMGGAPILAARAAAKCGAGRVYVAFLDHPPAYDSGQPELMCRAASELDFAKSILVLGPGLGNSRIANDVLARGLSTDMPLVLDADALNLIAAEPGLQQKLALRTVPSVLTPHPLEAARLLGIASTQIQADRLAAARELARLFNAIVILKGSGTVIAQPSGSVAINPTGNPALATAGTGDVLAGICGALLAQRWPAWEAALGAVWLHGSAADYLVAHGIGPVGMTASELIVPIRTLLNQLITNQAALLSFT